jgi:hypothetical protein
MLYLSLCKLIDKMVINVLTQELNPRNAACRNFVLGILIYKGLTACRLSRSALKGKHSGAFFKKMNRKY